MNLLKTISTKNALICVLAGILSIGLISASVMMICKSKHCDKKNQCTNQE